MMEEETTEEETEGQHKRQYDWLKQYQFQKGESGNPGGMKKGTKSMKTFAKEMMENMDDEEKAKFMKILHPAFVWRMAEGNPTNDITSGGKPIPIYGGEAAKTVQVPKDNSDNKDIQPEAKN